MRDPFEITTSLTSKKGKRPLEWEESAVDSHSSVNELHDAEHSAPPLLWLRFLVLAGFAVLAARIFYLQIVQGQGFRALSDSNRIRSQTILAPRGLVLDRTGQSLVQNLAGFNLVAFRNIHFVHYPAAFKT